MSDDENFARYQFDVPKVPIASPSNNSSNDELPASPIQRNNVLDASLEQSSSSLTPDVSFFKDVDKQMSTYDLKRLIEQMCTRIYRAMGPGFREKVYQHCLERELGLAGFVSTSEHPVSFFYMGVCVGFGYADVIVQERLVVELKAVPNNIMPQYINQTLQYMRALSIEHGIIVNFPQHRTKKDSVEVFDCFLGQKMSSSKLTMEQIRMADMGMYGPNPGKNRNVVPFSETIGYCVPLKSYDEKDDEREPKRKREDIVDKEEEERQELEQDSLIGPVMSSTFRLPSGQELFFKASVRPN